MRFTNSALIYTGFYLFVNLTFLSCTKAVEEPLNDINAGGSTTIFTEFSNSFQQPAANLDKEGLDDHRSGDLLFESIFVTSPSPQNSGLGPIFVQNACVSCHPKNGRAAFPESGSDMGGLLARISLPGSGIHGENISVPGFGTQLQTKANFGVIPEGQLSYFNEFIEGLMADGSSYTLRRPVFKIFNTYLPFPSEVQMSVRIGPPIFGLGLLESISEEELLKRVDPDDKNKDGISGRLNYVYDDRVGKMAIGRFGWKASQPSIYNQTAHAFLEDMGLSSPYLPQDPSYGQVQQDSKADDPEVTDDVVRLATFYAQSLGVPAPRRQNLPDVIYGKKLFAYIGCEKCHTSKMQTGPNSDHPFLANQSIQPYTDLLLHDMGPGLADHRSDGLANGNEWRTPPLWGIGLTQVVGGHTNFLHDGRARNLEEAIMWHDGEGRSSKDGYAKLSKKDREKLLLFLNSL